nr:MAG TPA: hypothetical protein [Caudoviricetes sp.]
MAGKRADSPFHGWYCHADRTRTKEQFRTGDALTGGENYDE